MRAHVSRQPRAGILMLIYLDSNIVQYCADYEPFIFGGARAQPMRDQKLRRELEAVRKLIELDQLGSWTIAASPQLLSELLAGRPTADQRKIYRLLLDAWNDSEWEQQWPIRPQKITLIEKRYARLGLSAKDLRHLAEAIALNASWFLTNDSRIINRCRDTPLPLRVSKVSDCLEDISVGLFLK